jgi:fused signal recognition particle receptor
MTDSNSDKKPGWFGRLTQGLTRTSKQMAEQVVTVLTKVELHEDTIAELEDLLVEADLGPAVASRVAQAYSRGRVGMLASRQEVMEGLANAIAKELAPHQGRFDPLSGGHKPYVVLFVGVNGSGKTTTLGKIAVDLKGRGAKVLIAAGDTFRAAAIEQLKIWGERAGVPVIASQIGGDSASLAYEALERAKAEDIDVLLIDTAGRLQNKTALMDELAKVVRVLKKLDPSGEGIDDLQPFDARAFARSLVGLEAS